MEFGLSDDQRMIEHSLRGYLEDQVPLDDIRRIAAGRAGFDDALWRGLTELGLPGLLIAEEHGGAGLSMLDAALVAESLGYAVAPAPFVGAAVMAPLAISLMGNDEQHRQWLPSIARGEMRVAVAVGAFAGKTGQMDLTLEGAQLRGSVSGVIDGGGATHILVFLPDGRCALAGSEASGVGIGPRPTIDRTRPLADVTFDHTTVAVLDGSGTPLDHALQVLDAGRVMLAADTLGAGQRMIEKAVVYAGERVQFDRIIASFQAVKHMCAEMCTALEPCRSLVWYAAHAQDHLPDERRVLACLVKAQLNDVGRDVARTATEVHGGMGFTDLMGLHFWFKRIGYNRQVLGGSERCRAEAAKVQGWAA